MRQNLGGGKIECRMTQNLGDGKILQAMSLKTMKPP